MIGASKILTVSYGTFSCTLEGFDDPFNTMKAIAEYFRDLAAGDRYFGAEPPTPDAAMLHQIAEREIQRRVEAKIQDNGVILRAAEGAPAQIAAPQQPRVLAPAMPEDPALSARLDRIRSAVAQSAQAEAVNESPPPQQAPLMAAPIPAPVPEADIDLLPEDAPAASTPEALPEDLPQPEPEGAPAADAMRAAAMDSAQAAEADFGAELLTGGFAETGTAAPAMEAAGFAAEAPPQDRVRARVIRIRRAPAQPAETIEALPPVAAPEIVVQAAPAPETAATETVIPVLAAESAAFALSDAPSLSDEDEADLLRELAALEAETFDPQPLADLPPADAPVIEADYEDDLAALDLSGLDLPTETETKTAAISPLAEAEDLADDLAEDLAPLLRDATPEAPATEAEAEVVAADAVYDEVVDIADFAGDAAEFALPDSAPRIDADLDAFDDAFDAEAEAALEAALQADEAPAAPAAAAPVAAEPVRPARPVRRLRVARNPQPEPAAPEADAARSRDRLPPTVDPVNEEEAVSRLLAETNSQMAGADNRRRLSAIAHLKAAVAATVADRRAGSSLRKTEEERVEPYREDLSRIVRPVQGAGGARPAPLVLVSELRVDPQPVTPVRPRPAEPAPAAATAAAAPIRPRRIGSAAVAAQEMIDDSDEDEIEAPLAPEEARGFADFADRLGAVSLPALLEAAAAYTACIEGRPHFSRPQLMRQVTTMAEDQGHSREDSLRSFGTLLREGRIVKVRRGQYALSEESHLLAKARKLMG